MGLRSCMKSGGGCGRDDYGAVKFSPSAVVPPPSSQASFHPTANYFPSDYFLCRRLSPNAQSSSASFQSIDAYTQSALPYPEPQNFVHFPPTPALSTTHPAHSAKSYDRTPIVVAPNVCALPERDCRMMYDTATNGVGAHSPPHRPPIHKLSRHVHPSALVPTSATLAYRHPSSSSYQAALVPPPPALTSDEGSCSSEESDGICSPTPPEEQLAYSRGSHHALVIDNHLRHNNSNYAPASASSSQCQRSLSFLPHAHERPRKRSNSPPKQSFSPWGKDVGCLGGF